LVLGDPQPHASGEVDVVLHTSGEFGWELKMFGEIHGKLPKKIRKKVLSSSLTLKLQNP
jgi:hypothetical protein